MSKPKEISHKVEDKKDSDITVIADRELGNSQEKKRRQPKVQRDTTTPFSAFDESR